MIETITLEAATSHSQETFEWEGSVVTGRWKLDLSSAHLAVGLMRAVADAADRFIAERGQEPPPPKRPRKSPGGWGKAIDR